MKHHIKLSIYLLLTVLLVTFLFTSCINLSNDELDSENPDLYLKNATLGGVIEYSLNADATGYIVTSYKGNDLYIAIPRVYNDLPVVGVSENAFYRVPVRTIIFPDSIQSISYGAVYSCKSIENVVFSANTQYSQTAVRECYPKNVYYKGGEVDWNVKKYSEEFYLQYAKVYFYSSTNLAGCWHYNKEGRIDIW